MYTESAEAEIIRTYWLILYGIAMMTTVFLYIKKYFVHDAIYRWHRTFWLVVAILSICAHYLVESLAQGYVCNSFLCNINILHVGIMSTITMGPANWQNAHTKAEEAVALAFF